LLVLVHVDDSRIIQFSHYSVKEFLTSARFGEKHNKNHDIISHRYHISMTSAHALIAQACFGILLHLDKDITRNSLRTYPLAKYAAKYWVEHVRFDGVSENVEEGMKRLLDTSKPHLAIWIWLCILEIPRTQTRHGRAKRPLPSVGSLLQYAVEHLRDSDVHAQQGHGAETMAQETDLSTPLLFALLKGSVNLTRWLVKHGADAMVQDKDGWTPLRSAMETVDLARLFVRHYADGGSTPLLSMVLKGTVDALRKFVEQFPDVKAQNIDALTQLLPALQEGSVKLACMLVKYGADVTALDDHGWTPLHWAVEAGSMGLTRLFVEYGADVEALANDGSTPLGLAMEAGRDGDLVAFLADHAVDTAAQGAEGSTSFNLATQEESMYPTPLLAGHSADASAQDAEGSTPFHLAVRGGNANLAVEAGREDLAPLFAPEAYAIAQDTGGSTPFNLAAREGSLNPTHLPAEYDAGATAQDTDRSTLLHSVVQGQNLDLARLLVEHGVDVTAKDNCGLTPLHWAVQVGSIDLARLFIRHGASVTAQDNGGLTPLDFALDAGREGLVCLLVGHIMDATAQDADESTRLDLEAQEENVEPTNLASEHGANAIDGDGSAVSQLEVDEESADYTRIIAEHDADAIAQDPDGSTPLHLAVQEEGTELQPLSAGYITGETAQDDSVFALSPEMQDESRDLTCLLVENSADATARDADEATPFHSTVQEGGAVPAHLPVEEGKGMTTEGEPGSSPLHIGHGTQDNQGQLRRIMDTFLRASEVVLVGVLFYCIVALKSYWLY
jgi:ankyrin repeat protein